MLRRDHYVKVLDFGLAKLADPGGTSSHFETQPGTLPGSVRYVAPERLLGEAADPRADVFSLGIVMYEMLAGEPPFNGNGVLDIIQAILKSEPASLHEARPEVPETLELIVKKALEKDPATRYQTAKELLTDLIDLRQILDYEDTERRLRARLKPKTE